MSRLTLVVLLLALLHVSAARSRVSLESSRPGPVAVKSSRPSVAVINGVGFHTEVYCALLWSLVQANVNISAHVLTNTISGIDTVISGWWAPRTIWLPAASPRANSRTDARTAGCCRWSEPFQEYESFLSVACDYSAVVFATFPDQHGQMAEQLANKCPGQKLVFVVHNSQELLRKGALLAPLHAVCT